MSLSFEWRVDCRVVVALVNVCAQVSGFNHVMNTFLFLKFCSRSLICDSNLSILASFALVM